MTVRGTTTRFSILLYLFWASVVSIEVFLVPFLISLGYSNSRAGYVMSAIFVVSIVSQPVWGVICDRTGRHREVVAGCLAVAAVAILLIPPVGHLFVAVLLLAAVYSATANSMPGIMDSWIMSQRAQHGRVDYGVSRAMGSLGYAVTSVILGVVYDRLGLRLNFSVYAVFIAAAIMITLSIRDHAAPAAHPQGAAAVPIDERAGGSGLINAAHDTGVRALARAVIANREYLWFLASALGIVIALRATMTFLPLLIYSVGGNNTHVGLAQAVGAGSEIPFMIAAAFLVRRFRPRYVLGISMAIFIVRVGLLGYVKDPTSLILVQLLHGASFGLFLPSAIYFIDRVAPAQFKTAFQTLAPAVYFALGSVIGSSAGGIFVDRMGLTALYRVAPWLILASVLLFVFAVVLQPPPEG